MTTIRTLLCYSLIVLQSRPNIARLPPLRDSHDYDYLNFSVINNSEVRRYAEEFNALCPHTALCDVNVNINHSLLRNMYRDFSKVPCCGECYCLSENCMVTRECCIDVLPKLLTSEEVRAVQEDPAECIFTQYRSYDAEMYNGLAYILVTECSESYHDEYVRSKCHKAYSEFNFVIDIPGYLPVTDNRTMDSYKNMFCGICNHVPRSELIFWDSGVVCNEPIALNDTENLQSLSDIEQFIARDGRCNLEFKVPSYLKNRQPPIRTCKPYIDTCNVTGLWQQYDPVLESLCTSYLSSYKEYKNVHCFLCNGYDRSLVEEICEEGPPIWRPSSFISLLDFNNLELSDEEMLETTRQLGCAEGQMYDIWTKECQHLYCPEFAILQDKKCYPVFNEGTYDVTIRLVPMEDALDVRFIAALQNLIADNVTRKVSAIKSATVELCEIKTFVKLQVKFVAFTEHLKEVSFADISYILNVDYVAFKVVVTAQDILDAVVSIKEITNVLYDQAPDMAAFETEFREVDFTLFDQQYTSTVTMENSLFARYKFFEPYADPIDGKTILPIIPKISDVCQKSPLQYHLLPFSLCPLMALKEYEYQVEGDVIFLKGPGIYLKKPDVYFSQNSSTTITVCSDSYFSSKNEFIRTFLEKNPYAVEIIVSVICTSVSLACLLIVFVTYCCFTALRTLPGLNNMALVLALFFAQLFYLMGGTFEIKTIWICEAIGLLLHFCLLASFFWMGICTFHMMMVFVFISKRSGSENTRAAFIRYTVIANLAAALLVCINIIVSVTSGGPGFGYGGQPCYVTDNFMIFYTVAIPLGIVIFSNLIMFLCVIIKVSRLPDVKKNTKHERRNIIIFAKLSTLTGLTWAFAYIYQWTEIKAFTYLFIVANASQGLFIMFSFIINKRVWGMIGQVLFKHNPCTK